MQTCPLSIVPLTSHVKQPFVGICWQQEVGQNQDWDKPRHHRRSSSEGQMDHHIQGLLQQMHKRGGIKKTNKLCNILRYECFGCMYRIVKINMWQVCVKALMYVLSWIASGYDWQVSNQTPNRMGITSPLASRIRSNWGSQHKTMSYLRNFGSFKFSQRNMQTNKQTNKQTNANTHTHTRGNWLYGYEQISRMPDGTKQD